MNVSKNTAGMVEIRDLKKRFGRTAALDGVDMEILPGRIMGLLGAKMTVPLC